MFNFLFFGNTIACKHVNDVYRRCQIEGCDYIACEKCMETCKFSPHEYFCAEHLEKHYTQCPVCNQDACPNLISREVGTKMCKTCVDKVKYHPSSRCDIVDCIMCGSKIDTIECAKCRMKGCRACFIKCERCFGDHCEKYLCPLCDRMIL